MRLLVTNDDGVHAPGLLALAQALRTIAEVFVVAPEKPRSAAGHCITLHKPLRMSTVTLADGTTAYSSNGTPADCAALGSLEVMNGEVDLVVAGINHGPNLGWDVYYSGTVAAAREAAMLGFPSIAVSVPTSDPDVHWESAQDVILRMTAWRIEANVPADTMLNVNVPNVSRDEIKGISVTRLGPRHYTDRINKRIDPTGRPYFWVGGRLVEHPSEPGTDGRAIMDSFVSVTPLQLDVTAYDMLASMKDWKGNEFRK
jgi:5'-nucleotidase